MNGPKYVKMVADKLKIHMQVYKRKIFMQGDAPCHSSKVSNNFLDNNNIELLEWTGNSPDFNSIENLRTNLKNKVLEEQLSSNSKLVKVMKEVWVKEISKD